jgi:hypothetical protein
MLLIDLIIIFEYLIECLKFHVLVLAMSVALLFSFTLKCAILGVNICLPYIYPLRVNDEIFTPTLTLQVG